MSHFNKLRKSLLYQFSSSKFMFKNFFESSGEISTLGIALILVKNTVNGKYLAVN